MAETSNEQQRTSPFRALLALTGVSALFVNFAYDYSPLKGLLEGFWVYAAPAFLTIPITAGYLRSNSASGLSVIERYLYYALGAVGLCLVFYPWVWSLLFDPTAIDLSSNWFATVILLAGPLFGLWGLSVFVRAARMKSPPEAPAVLGMRVVYVANALTCFAVFSGALQVGALLILAVSSAYLVILIRDARRSRLVRQPDGVT